MDQPDNENTELSGSYSISDCEFLLKLVDVKPVSVEQKEHLLQSGTIHYSEIVSEEKPPSSKYIALFKVLTERYADRLAREILYLSQKIDGKKIGHITVVSLARAGTPIGVLINRALKSVYKRSSKHYSISIIRDKGIDKEALKYIASTGVSGASVIFVDGWTAKGVINSELKASIKDWNSQNTYQFCSDLAVISDLSGTAELIATNDDYAIPSGILNSTISGLLSRTMQMPGEEGLHQCIIYRSLRNYDLSNWFVDEIQSRFETQLEKLDSIIEDKKIINSADRKLFIDSLMIEYDVDNVNKIKPGVAEATRVMLRRVPRLLIVNNTDNIDVQHLIELAQISSIPIVIRSDSPYSAVAIIKNVFS